jgi:hypothetical protein
MDAYPAATAVTTPPLLTAAIDASELDHVPPEALALNMALEPVQREGGPVTVGGASCRVIDEPGRGQWSSGPAVPFASTAFTMALKDTEPVPGEGAIH